MIIYLDNNYKCHTQNEGTMREIDVPAFDGKCKEYIEGYRFIPSGETWTDTHGNVFEGQFLGAWRAYTELTEIQTAVDRTQAEADEQIMGLLDTIEYLIIGG